MSSPRYVNEGTVFYLLISFLNVYVYSLRMSDVCVHSSTSVVTFGGPTSSSDVGRKASLSDVSELHFEDMSKVEEDADYEMYRGRTATATISVGIAGLFTAYDEDALDDDDEEDDEELVRELTDSIKQQPRRVPKVGETMDSIKV